MYGPLFIIFMEVLHPVALVNTMSSLFQTADISKFIAGFWEWRLPFADLKDSYSQVSAPGSNDPFVYTVKLKKCVCYLFHRC